MNEIKNTDKFNSKAEVYAKSRPEYPKEIFETLISNRIIGPKDTVADIGSGTGIFTVRLAKHVKHIFAIEPNDDMRTKGEIQYRQFSNITSVDASAENTSLADRSIDVITVAQAFHWFDRALFKNECIRILKQDGKVILVWNDRDVSDKLIQDNFAINRLYCPNFKGASNGISFEKESFENFFAGEFQILAYRITLEYDRDTFIARNLSSSYAPKPSDPQYIHYTNALNELFDKNCKKGLIHYPYITRCYIGKV